MGDRFGAVYVTLRETYIPTHVKLPAFPTSRDPLPFCRLALSLTPTHSLTPSPAGVLVDRLLPDDVVRARDGELAAEPDLRRGDLLVADDAVNHDVVRAARLVQRHRRLAVVELAGGKWGKEWSEEFEAFVSFQSVLP